MRLIPSLVQIKSDGGLSSAEIERMRADAAANEAADAAKRESTEAKVGRHFTSIHIFFFSFVFVIVSLLESYAVLTPVL